MTTKEEIMESKEFKYFEEHVGYAADEIIGIILSYTENVVESTQGEIFDFETCAGKNAGIHMMMAILHEVIDEMTKGTNLTIEMILKNMLQVDEISMREAMEDEEWQEED